MSKKPTPPAYALGMDPADYDWSHHRYMPLDDGGCAIPDQGNTTHETSHTTTGEENMATAKKITKKVSATESSAAEKSAQSTASTKTVKKEKVVKEGAPKFSADCVELLKQNKFTDEEIAEKLSSTFPEKKDVPGAIKWYRRELNMKLQEAGEPVIEELVKDAKGKTVQKSTIPPVEKPKKEKTDAEVPAVKSAKATPEKKATPVKKTASTPAKKVVKKVAKKG